MPEELQKRAEQKPDKFTVAWWNEQFQHCIRGYQGATHAINRALADNEDLGRDTRVLMEKVRALEADRDSDRAKIGELEARIDKAAELVTKLKQQNGKNP